MTILFLRDCFNAANYTNSMKYISIDDISFSIYTYVANENITYVVFLLFRFTDYNYRTNLRRNHLQQRSPTNAESLWPVGVFLPPVDINDLGYSWNEVRRGHPDIFKTQGKDFSQ